MAAANPDSDDYASILSAASAGVSRRGVLGAGGLGLMGLLLAGCGASNSTQPMGGAATGTPKRGGTLRLAVSDGDSTDSLDPGLIITQNSAIVCNALYDTLTNVDDNFDPSPALATSWQSTPDATTWTFHLRKGVKWHDGTDFTAADVAATFRRWVDPKSGSQMYGQMSDFIDPGKIRTPDPHTVVLTLKKPNSVLATLVGAHWAAKVTKAGVTAFSSTAVGTGPFRLTSWKPGTTWAAVRNAAYWGGAPNLDGLQVTVTPDQGAIVQGVLAGSTDCTDGLSISLWSSLQGQANASLQTYKNKAAWAFAFDQRHAPFNNQKVLDALKLATDRDALVRIALQGHGTVIDDFPVAPGSVFYPAGQTPEFNIAKAKSLLAEAGYPNGIDIELSTSNVLAGMLDMAQAWQQVVAPAGIRVSLKQFPLTTYWSQGWMATPAFQDDMNRFYPASALGSFYTSSGPWNDTRYTDPRLPGLIDKIFRETDSAARVDLIHQALVIARETYGFILPCFTDGGWAQSSKVGGVNWNFVNTMDFRKAWINA